MKSVNAKPNYEKKSFKIIGKDIIRDYASGLKISEIAKKYDRSENSVRSLINKSQKTKYGAGTVEVMRLINDSNAYKIKLAKVKEKMEIGKKLMIKGRTADDKELEFTNMLEQSGKKYYRKLKHGEIIIQVNDAYLKIFDKARFYARSQLERVLVTDMEKRVIGCVMPIKTIKGNVE